MRSVLDSASRHVEIRARLISVVRLSLYPSLSLATAYIILAKKLETRHDEFNHTLRLAKKINALFTLKLRLLSKEPPDLPLEKLFFFFLTQQTHEFFTQ